MPPKFPLPHFSASLPGRNLCIARQGRRRLGRTPLKLRRPKSKRPLRLVLSREGYTKVRLRVDLSRDNTARAKLEALFELVP